MTSKENPKWTKERWELEKENVEKCLAETKSFIKKNKNIKSEKIKIETVEDFAIATEKKKLLEKIDSKNEYVSFLENRLKQINNIIGG